MAMKLTLTAEQSAQLAPSIRHGWTLIGKIEREPFTGSNAGTSGRLIMECGSVPSESLPALRSAIRLATKPSRRKAKP